MERNKRFVYMLVAMEVRPSVRPSFNSNEDIKVFYCRKVKTYLVPSFIYGIAQPLVTFMNLVIIYILIRYWMVGTIDKRSYKIHPDFAAVKDLKVFI